MALRLALTLILLLVAACLGALGWFALAPETAPPALTAAALPEPPRLQAVLVAGRALRAGSLLGPEDLAPASLPAEAVPPGSRPDTPAARAELVGGMLRRSVAAGEPLRAGEDVLRPGDRGFLAAVLGPGLRAVSIGVDAVSGAAGLIWPGDRVDLLLTQTLDEASLPAAHRVAGETVLADLRVIAIDQTLVQGAASLESGPERGSRTVTLEVTPEQAERVAVAARLGRLALAVRAALGAEAPPVSRTPLTWGGDVSPALRTGRNPAGATLRLFQGPSKTEEFRF